MRRLCDSVLNVRPHAFGSCWGDRWSTGCYLPWQSESLEINLRIFGETLVNFKSHKFERKNSEMLKKKTEIFEFFFFENISEIHLKVWGVSLFKPNFHYSNSEKRGVNFCPKNQKFWNSSHFSRKRNLEISGFGKWKIV